MIFDELKQKDRETERQNVMKTERQKDRKTKAERQKNRKTKKQKDKKRGEGSVSLRSFDLRTQ